MAHCSQPLPLPLRLEALPDDAVQAISHCLTTPSCPGPCQLAPVSKSWRRAALQHLAGATVALRLGCVGDWEGKQLQQRQLQERQQNLPGGHLPPSHGPSNSKNRQTGVRAAALKAIGTPQQRLQAATQADQQRLTSLAAWLLQHGPYLGGLALTLAAPPGPNSSGEAAAQQAVASLAAGVTRVMDTLVAAAAAEGMATEGAAAAGQLDAEGCEALAAAGGTSAAAVGGGTPDPAAAPAAGGGAVPLVEAGASTAGGAVAAAAGAALVAPAAAAVVPLVASSSSAGALRLRTLRLGVAGRPLPALGRVLAAAPHLVALRLDQWQHPPAAAKDWPCSRHMAQQLAEGLPQLPHLTSLQVWSGWLAVKGPAAWGVREIPTVLQACPSSLEVLVVTGPPVDWMWQDLGHLTRLRQLQMARDLDYDGQGTPEDELYDSATLEAAAAAAAGLTRLTALECAAALNKGGALLQLPSLVAVGSLAEDAPEALPSAAAMRQLASIPTLRRLTLWEPGCEEAVEALGALTQLEELTIGDSCDCSDVMEPQDPEVWCEALGALTQLTRLQAPMRLLLGEEGSGSPLGQLQQLRVVAVSTVFETQVQQLLQALAAVPTLQEVHLGRVREKGAKAARAAAEKLLPGVHLVISEELPVCCSVVEEVLG